MITDTPPSQILRLIESVSRDLSPLFSFRTKHRELQVAEQHQGNTLGVHSRSILGTMTVGEDEAVRTYKIDD